ncbi:MAG: hypothetical protein JST93_07215 [Acidobacteria bacterium]|nr:hypothetical protein [Acidobacteriota bacterium]
MRLNNTGKQNLAVLALLAFSSVPGQGDIGAPVGLSLSSVDELRAGQPVTVIVVLEPGENIPYATFEVDHPAYWQVLDGSSRWSGALENGKMIELRFRAVPLSEDPRLLMASLKVDGYPVVRAGLDPRRMGRRFPEQVRLEPEQAGKAAPREAAESYYPQFEPDVLLPEPAEATLPRVPGEGSPRLQTEEAHATKSGARSAVAVSATGRWTFLDAAGVRRGVRNATVELRNDNGNFLVDLVCGRSTTDGNGNFAITGACFGIADPTADLYVRLVLNNSVVEVKPDNTSAGTYTFRSPVVNNTAGPVTFGTLTVPASTAGAAAAHNLVMRAQQFMATAGESMTKVTVLWPSTSDKPVSFYTKSDASLHIKESEPFKSQWTIFHEYGHHVLFTKAESPAPDYDNGICDTPGHPGHCVDLPEKGVVAWTEGFPDFLGSFLHGQFAAIDGFPKPPFDIENLVPAAGSEALAEQIEGVTAAILLDLADTTNEPGDSLSLTFSTIWDIVKNFDPSSATTHNHPTSILEFYDGMRQRQIGLINRVAETYIHNRIQRPLPDLVISSAANPPSLAAPGGSFTHTSVVRNAGTERANSAFTLRYFLATGTSTTMVAVPFASHDMGANMLAGTGFNAVETLTIPASIAPGSYKLMVCADFDNRVPELSDVNNCKTSATTLVVALADAVTGLPSR